MPSLLEQLFKEGGDSFPANLPPGVFAPSTLHSLGSEDGSVITLVDGIATWVAGSAADDSDSVADSLLSGLTINTGVLLYGQNLGQLSTLGLGATGTLLQSDGTYPSWDTTLTGAYTFSAAQIFSGTVDISGIVNIDNLLQVTRTTEQLRLRYDSSNYLNTTVASDGGVTFDAVGTGAGFVFSDGVSISGLLTADLGLTVTSGQTLTL